MKNVKFTFTETSEIEEEMMITDEEYARIKAGEDINKVLGDETWETFMYDLGKYGYCGIETSVVMA